MARARVVARHLVDGKTVMDMLPVVWRDIGRIDAERLHGVDDVQHALDLGPAVHAQKDVAAGTYERKRLVAFAWDYGTHDVGAGEDGAVIVGGPAHEAEDAAGREADHA